MATVITATTMMVRALKVKTLTMMTMAKSNQSSLHKEYKGMTINRCMRARKEAKRRKMAKR
jgi:hypothetical protein